MSLDYSKDTVLFEFKAADGKPPSREDFQRNFGLCDHELDPVYPFILMEKGTFVTVIAKEASDRIQAEGHPDFIGAFANGRTGPAVNDAEPPARRRGGGFALMR